MKPDLRLALPVLIAWAAVGVLIGFPAVLAGAAVLSWPLALICLGLAMTQRSRRRALLLMFTVALAAVAMLVTIAAVKDAERRPAGLVDAATAGRFVTATAETSQLIRPGAPFSAVLRSVVIGGREQTLTVPVLVFVEASRPVSFGIGSTLQLAGKLAPTAAGDDVGFLFFASRPPVVLHSPPWFLDWANQLRTGFRGVAATLPGDGGGLLPGLAIGDTAAVSSPLDTAMKTTSLSHLTAVSGANCAVVIGLVMLAGAAAGVPRAGRVAIAVLTLLGFVVLVTPEPSVLRAAVMATIVLGALVGGRAVRGIPTLALAVIVLLAVDPWMSRSYGFILSVLATGGLLVLSGPLSQALARWLPQWLAAVLAIPLSAQLACQPVLVLLNPTIPVYGVLANVLAEPAAPVATVLGLISCLLLPVVPTIGIAVAHLAWIPSAWIAAIATFFAGLPGNSLPWAPGPAGVALTASAVLVLVAALVLPSSRQRRIAAFSLALALVGYGGIATATSLQRQLSRPADWQIALCDIGQGDAIVVRSLGKIALIDTGPDPKALTDCLSDIGVSHIDLLVLSHWDLDHVGGTSAVFGRVTRALVGPDDGSKASHIGAELTRSGANVTQVSRGETGELGELGWEILWPRQPLAGVQPGNDASVTVRMAGVGACAGGCLSVLFLGDLGRQPQALLMAANRIERVDVVKVAHHGSADQNPGLYSRLQAVVGLVSVGASNSYGHPTAALLTMLADSGTQVTRTDLQGLVLLAPGAPGSGASVEVWTEHPLARDKVRSR